MVSDEIQVVTSHLPEMFSQDEAHGYTTKPEEPCLVGNAAEELGNQLFTRDIMGYMANKVEVGMY